MRRRLLLALLVALTPARLLADAAPAYLVADLNTDPVEDSGSYPHGFVTLDGVAYFVARHALLGIELFRSDGTAAGTWMVADLNPGEDASWAGALTVIGGRLWFGATDGRNGWGVWRSDGTAAGTELVAVPRPHWFGNGTLAAFTPVGNAVFFVAQTETQGAELWRSDGTAAGTSIVQDIVPGEIGSDPRALVALGDVLYFVADDGVHGAELWRSDGTDSGTYMVRDIRLGSSGGIARSARPRDDDGRLAVAGEHLLFAADDGAHGVELWRSDGNADGTVLLLDSHPDSTFGGLRIFDGVTPFGRLGGDALFFSLDSTRMPADLTLWRSDGTVEGTSTLGAVRPTGRGNLPGGLTVIGDAVYFTYGFGSFQTNLWRVAAGVATEVRRFPGPIGAPVVLDGRLLFVARDDDRGPCGLWRSDGTSAGTTQVRAGVTSAPGCSSGLESMAPPYIGELSGRILLSADTPEDGAELFVSDGTAAGTGMVRNLSDDGGRTEDAPLSLVTGFGDLLLFTQRQAGEPYSRTWRSDGTPAGTRQIAAMPPWDNGGVVDGRFVFFATIDGEAALWSSDGTDAGTAPFLAMDDVGAFLTSDGPILFFALQTGRDDDAIDELWRSDGTPAGTFPVYRPPRLPRTAFETLRGFVGGAVFAVHGSASSELWRSDGTAEGTRRVVALSDPPRFISDMIVVEDDVYLRVVDGAGGDALWRSDGSTAGTRPVVELGPSGLSLALAWLTPGSDALFFAADDGVTGYELWRSDGSAAGTRQVRDIRPGSPGALIHGSGGRAGDALLFVADDGRHGIELWSSDGTAAGTRLIRDIDPRLPAVIHNTYLPVTEIGDQVVFAPVDAEGGREPWVSDGTTAGTRRLADIGPGPRSGLAQDVRFVATGTHVFFAADDGRTGSELWAIPRAALDGGPGCGGDCNGDFRVAIDELVRGVGIALGTTPVSACASFDADADDAVSIDELIGAVNAALAGC